MSRSALACAARLVSVSRQAVFGRHVGDLDGAINDFAGRFELVDDPELEGLLVREDLATQRRSRVDLFAPGIAEHPYIDGRHRDPDLNLVESKPCVRIDADAVVADAGGDETAGVGVAVDRRDQWAR